MLTALDGLEMHISPGPLCQIHSSVFFCFVATVGSKSIARIKLPHSSSPVIDSHKRVHMVSQAQSVFLIRLRILMDFSVPLTDDSGSGQNASSRRGHLNLVVARAEC